MEDGKALVLNNFCSSEWILHLVNLAVCLWWCKCIKFDPITKYLCVYKSINEMQDFQFSIFCMVI